MTKIKLESICVFIYVCDGGVYANNNSCWNLHKILNVHIYIHLGWLSEQCLIQPSLLMHSPSNAAWSMKRWLGLRMQSMIWWYVCRLSQCDDCKCESFHPFIPFRVLWDKSSKAKTYLRNIFFIVSRYTKVRAFGWVMTIP